MDEQDAKMTRTISQVDSILGVPFKVLDDGFVRVVDYMGSDESIVQARESRMVPVRRRYRKTGD